MEPPPFDLTEPPRLEPLPDERCGELLLLTRCGALVLGVKVLLGRADSLFLLNGVPMLDGVEVTGVEGRLTVVRVLLSRFTRCTVLLPPTVFWGLSVLPLLTVCDEGTVPRLLLPWLPRLLSLPPLPRSL